MKLAYGSYVFPRTPSITQAISFEEIEDENKIKVETWTIEGSLVPSPCGLAQVIALMETLIAAIEVSEQTFQIREDDDSVIYEIKAEDCVEGPRFTDYRISEPRKGFLVNNAQYELTMEAKKPIEPGEEVYRKLTVNYSYDVFGLLTITERGEIEYKQNATMEVPSSIISVNSQNFSTTRNFEYSDDKTMLTYTYTYTQKSLEVPAALDAIGVEDWSISLSSKTDQGGTPEYTISGSCKLRGAGRINLPLDDRLTGADLTSPQGAAFSSAEDELYGSVGATLQGNMERLIEFIENELLSPAVSVTARNTRLNPKNRTVSFSFSYNVPGKSGSGGGATKVTSEFSYSFSYSGGEIAVNEVRRLGTVPYVQKMSINSTKFSESGNIKSRENYPAPPMPFIQDVILTNCSVNNSPNYDAAGNAIYETSWRYSYVEDGDRGIQPDFFGRARALAELYRPKRRGRPRTQPRGDEIGRRQIGF